MEEKDYYLLITRYLSQQTTTEENEILADWIASSSDNEQQFYEIKNIWALSKPAAQPGAHAALSKLKQKIADAEQAPVTKKLHPAKWYAVAASVFGLIAVLVHASYFSGSTPVQTLTQVTRAGQKKSFKLDDGTMVHLAPQSSVSYPAKLGATARVVELKGEAYFEVSKNPHRPFTVHTSNMDVQVLGTHFNVKSYQSNHLTTVSLLEGKVKVMLNAEDGPDEYLLKPGQELAFNHISHRVYQHSFDPHSVTGWMNNILVFKNDRLADAAEKMERIYGIKIVFADQATGDTRLYATFENESLRNVLETIKAAGNVAYTVAGNKVYLTLNQ